MFLKYVGTHGSDACIENLGAMFGVAAGACANYIHRVTSSLMSLYGEIVSWPSAGERRELSARIQAGHMFPNCVGMIDGTLLPLAFKTTLNGEDYFTWKGCYALNALVRCDGKARVIYVLAGWPGSSHDNRVWSNAAPFRDPVAFFSSNQYLLGDTAFRPSQHIVPPYKKLPGALLSREQEFFNSKLSIIRVRSEHCIGLVKARFQFFKGVRIIIRHARDLRRIIRLFMTAVVIHNLLVEEPLPAELREETEAECVSEDAMNEERDACEGSVLAGADESDRREQLFHYLVEKDGRF